MLEEIPGASNVSAPTSLLGWLTAAATVAVPSMLWGISRLRIMWSRDAVDRASADGQGDVIATLRAQLAAETERANKNGAARDAAIDQIGQLRVQVQDLTLQVQLLTAQVQSLKAFPK